MCFVRIFSLPLFLFYFEFSISGKETIIFTADYEYSCAHIRKANFLSLSLSLCRCAQSTKPNDDPREYMFSRTMFKFIVVVASAKVNSHAHTARALSPTKSCTDKACWTATNIIQFVIPKLELINKFPSPIILNERECWKEAEEKNGWDSRESRASATLINTKWLMTIMVARG